MTFGLYFQLDGRKGSGHTAAADASNNALHAMLSQPPSNPPPARFLPPSTAHDAAFFHHDDIAPANIPVPDPHAGNAFHPPIIG
jgi:hypothetical protein